MIFNVKNVGKCCSNYLPLSETEIKEMKKRAIKENKILLDKNWYDICPFLNYRNECDIYENRPLICRKYDCYKFENLVFDYTKEELKIKRVPVNIRKVIFNSEV